MPTCSSTAAIADLLYSDQYDDLLAVEEQVGKRVVVRPVLGFHPEQYEVQAR